MKHGKAVMRVWQNKVVIISLIEANKFEIFVCSCWGEVRDGIKSGLIDFLL